MQRVQQQARPTKIEAIFEQRACNLHYGDLDGIGVFKRRQFAGGRLGVALAASEIVLLRMEVAVVVAEQRRRAAAQAVGLDVLAVGNCRQAGIPLSLRISGFSRLARIWRAKYLESAA